MSNEVKDGTNPHFKIRLVNIVYIAIAIVVVIGVVVYVLSTASGGTVSVGNGWTYIKGESVLSSDGKVDFYSMGLQYCEYCAVENYAIFEALSNFGDWTYYGKPINLSSIDPLNASSQPHDNAILYQAEEGDWTLYLLNPHLSYYSQYVNFTLTELSYNNGSNFMSPTMGEAPYVSKYNPDIASPFSVVGGNFFEIGAVDSLVSSGVPILFNESDVTGYRYGAPIFGGYPPAYIFSQLKQPSSVIANGINTEAAYISAVLCYDLALSGKPTMPPVCSSSDVQGLGISSKV